MPFIGASVKQDLALWPGARANEARVKMTLGIGRAAGAMLPEAGAKTALRDHSPTRRLDNMIKEHDSAQAPARATRSAMPMTSDHKSLRQLTAVRD
jgi:3-hydroxyisobutyrate dehydrogenase-like beta-hydroxyacid dehydrogenase